MDKTVKLWHVDRDRCLQTFEHEDFVTSVKFHPLDDRFFLSGSLDNGVRLWSVLENSVSYSKNLGDEVLITALEFRLMVYIVLLADSMALCLFLKPRDCLRYLE